MNVSGVVTTTHKKRFGLIAARIGASFGHRITIPVQLHEPVYSSITANALGQHGPAKTRTTVSRSSAKYAYGTNPRDGSPFPTAALPGATVYLEVQDLSRVEEELAEKAKWKCLHRECAGVYHESKEELIRAHAKNAELVDEAERDPLGGQAHVYLGVIEVPATDDQKVKRGDKEVLVKGQPATVMLVSDEE